MPLAVYKKNCKTLEVGSLDENSFTHAYFTIKWNLMARADSVVNLGVEHVEWNSDCLVFYFCYNKK